MLPYKLLIFSFHTFLLFCIYSYNCVADNPTKSDIYLNRTYLRKYGIHFGQPIDMDWKIVKSLLADDETCKAEWDNFSPLKFINAMGLRFLLVVYVRLCS